MFNGKIHYIWSFSMVMLVYQRVPRAKSLFHSLHLATSLQVGPARRTPWCDIAQEHHPTVMNISNTGYVLGMCLIQTKTMWDSSKYYKSTRSDSLSSTATHATLLAFENRVPPSLWHGHVLWLVVYLPLLKNMLARLDHHPNYWEK